MKRSRTSLGTCAEFARRDRTHKRLWGHTSRVGSINRRTIALAFIPCFAAIATRMAALLVDVPWFAANAVGVAAPAAPGEATSLSSSPSLLSKPFEGRRPWPFSLFEGIACRT